MIWHLAATPCDTTSIDTTKEDYLARLQHCAWHLALISHTNYHQLDTISGIHWYWYPIGLEQNENSTYIALFYTTLLSPTPFKTPLSQLRPKTLSLLTTCGHYQKWRPSTPELLQSHEAGFSLLCPLRYSWLFLRPLVLLCQLDTKNERRNWHLKGVSGVSFEILTILCNFGVFFWQHFRSVAALQLKPLSWVQTW